MSPFTRWSIGAIGRRVALLVGVGSGATIYYERPMPSDPDLVKKQVMIKGLYVVYHMWFLVLGFRIYG